MAREAMGKALPAKWLAGHSPGHPIQLPDRFGWLAQAVDKDAAARPPEAAKAWHRHINAIHQAPPEKRREAADRAAVFLLRQTEVKVALAEQLKGVSRAGRKAAYQKVREQLARAVEHQVKQLVATWAREKTDQGMDRLAKHIARSVSWAADYAAFQRSNDARRMAASMWMGLLQQACREEREAEARALEEAARKRRVTGGQVMER